MAAYDLTLEEMLADPIVRRLMERDGVVEAEVRGLADYVRRRRSASFNLRSPSRIAEESRALEP
ncbi:hypothetical protein [Brevundimonas sp. SL130]|uniref:hypothetical protein n=1 Tax=Brevundimonas sp. SL130 TaxID=2995143 RepID=UPI00226CA865|nr:hypothetical protein [Brevundimonas sp. SL130]WAC58590.1 hypothetical protein OU998_10150 [Brevundimonas sp. SL130]